MDERIRRRLEDYLSGDLPAGADPSFDRALEARPEAKKALQLFAEQSEAIRRTLRAPEGIGPAPGFYARVMARVEEESRSSMWSMFTGVFGQRLVLAASMLVLLLGVLAVLWSIDWRAGLAMAGFAAAGLAHSLGTRTLADR